MPQRVDVVAGGRDPVVMVVSGEAYAPYVRVFDRYGNMTSTVFSSNKLNGQQYLADFLKNMAASDFVDSMSGQERGNLCTYIADQLSDPGESTIHSQEHRFHTQFCPSKYSISLNLVIDQTGDCLQFELENDRETVRQVIDLVDLKPPVAQRADA